MIELRALGTLALRDRNGEDLHSVLAQPKRVALLAYLAIARPRGFHRRDTLLALLWPEQDEQHARGALNQALRHLRTALGKETVPSRGDGEIGIDVRALSCDAVEFDAAIEADDPARALGLYRGNLLEGFHVSGGGEFERWLEEERVWLRRRAARAAAALAHCEEARGEPVAAGHWARRAFALAPDDEGEARNLIALLGRLGDRAGAVQAYEEFARRLRVEYEVEPAPETLATIRAVRTRQVATTPSPAAAADQLPDGVGPVDPKPTVRASPPRAPAPQPESLPAIANAGSPLPENPRRRWVALGFIGLVVLGAIGLLGLGVRGVGAPDLPAQPTAIAILPFAYRGDPEFSYLSEGMADLLSARADGAAGLRSIDQRALLTFLDRKGGIANSDHGRLAAERFGAGFFVLGSAVETGGRLQLSATIYDERAGPRSSVETVAGSESEIFHAADRLARHILAKTQDRRLALPGIAGQTTSSLPAFKAYLEGEREGRAGRYEEAQVAFRRATELDTTFALAYYRLAMTLGPAPALEAMEHALRHGERLVEHHRWAVEAAAAYFRGDHRLADQRSRQVLTVRPDDAGAWLLYAVITLDKGSVLGRAWVDAREGFERALALGPENADAVWWLAAIAATERRLPVLDSLTNRLLQLDAPPWMGRNAQGLRAVMTGDTAGEARFVADLRVRPDPWAAPSAGVVAWMAGDLSAGRRLWRLITEPHRSPGFRMIAHVTLAKLELTGGRWGAASTELQALGALDAGAALEHHAFYALTRFLKPARSELTALRDSLQHWNPSSAREEGDGLIAIHRSAHPYLRLYLLGMLNARLGEPAAALGYAAELERADRSSPLGVFASDQALFVRAEVAWQGGRREEALTLLDQAPYWTTDSRRPGNGDSPFFIQLHERFARAELLYELGRYEDALPWYRALSYRDFLYTAPAHLRLAQIYERRGQWWKAFEHYDRFLELWRDSDPALQPLVQQAREAMARLR
jgi:DNA-binding SARP family transcriptional activator/TolB-like protein